MPARPSVTFAASTFASATGMSGSGGSGVAPSSNVMNNATALPSNISSAADFLKGEESMPQAILLADSFTTAFRPLTLQVPKVLLPYQLVPMIDYALEFLTSQSITDIFVFASNHSSLIQTHLQASKWANSTSYTVRLIVSDHCASIGDALRHMDTLNLIKGDFFLLSADVITNIRLAPLIQFHREKCKKDKNTLLTSVVFPMAKHHRANPLRNDLIIGVNPETSQLVCYENEASEGGVQFDASSFIQHPTITFLSDIHDPCIDLCTPSVLLQFTENFDWQDLRKDFVKGIIFSEDLFGLKIYTYTYDSTQYYIARLNDLYTYHNCTQDGLQRWTFPLCPDSNFFEIDSAPTTFRHSRGHLYREEGVKIGSKVKIGPNVIIGANTVIEDSCKIDNCVIGRNCRIGKNTTLQHCHLFRNVSVGQGAALSYTILADNVKVGSRAVINKGSVISYGVEIAADHIVPAYSKITRINPDTLDEDDISNLEIDDGCDMKAVGAGKGYFYTQHYDTEDEEDYERIIREYHANSFVPDAKAIRSAKQKLDDKWESEQLKRELIWDEEMEDEFDDDASVANSEDYEHTTITHSTLPSSIRVNSDDAAQEMRFATEAFDTLRRGREQQLDVDSINLEMSSLRMSTNVRMDVYVKVIFLALFDFLPFSATADDKDQWSLRRAECAQPSKKILSSLMSNLKYWSPLLQKVVGSVSEIAVKEQVSLLKSLESACSWKDGVYHGLFAKTVQFLYEPLEILSEEAVELWEQDIEQSDASGRQQWLVLTEAFRNWLKEAEEEDEDDED